MDRMIEKNRTYRIPKDDGTTDLLQVVEIGKTLKVKDIKTNKIKSMDKQNFIKRLNEGEIYVSASILQCLKKIVAEKKFYHGSYETLPIGTILKPQGNIKTIPNFEILEKYRPKEMLSLKDSVFLVANDEDIDACGGGTDYVFTVTPIGKIEKHNLAWSTEISKLEKNDPKYKEKEQRMAENYWNGIGHPNGVWEYLTPAAKIIKVEEF
jgi:hypothetical protein